MRTLIFHVIAITLYATAYAGQADRSRVSAINNCAQGDRNITSLDIVEMSTIGGRAGNGLGLSPDGQWVAFEMHRASVANDTYDAAWYVSSTVKDVGALKVGSAGDPRLFRKVDDLGLDTGTWVTESPLWSADSRFIYYRRRDKGETQVWRSSVDGKVQEQVTHNAADVEEISWSRDHSKFYFAVDITRAEREALNRRRFESGSQFDLNERWSRSHARQIEPRYKWLGGKPSLWVYELSSKTERKASEMEVVEHNTRMGEVEDSLKSMAPNARDIALSPNGDSVGWIEPSNAKLRGLNPPVSLFAYTGLTGMAEGVIKRCSNPECTGLFKAVGAAPIWWSEDGTKLYFVRMEGPNYGRRRWYSWSINSGRFQSILKSDGDVISSCSFRADKAICFKETETSPRSVVSIDLKSGIQTTLFDPNPCFYRLKLGTTERLEWSDGRGNQTFGWLVKPIGYRQGERYPLVIVGYRGRGLLTGGVGAEYPVYVFAANGFAVLVYDAPEQWQAQATISNQQELVEATWGSSLFEASAPIPLLRAVIDLLSERGPVDKNKVGITGFSTGVSHVNYGLIHTDLFAAAAISHPDWSPTTYFLSGGSSDGREMLRRIGMGPLSRAPDETWHALSLGLNVQKINVPVLINTSDEEYLAALETVISFADAGKPIVELFVYPDEDHGKWHPAHRYSIFERNVDWFSFWLQGIERSPRKVDQYERWRAIRQNLNNTHKSSSARKAVAAP